MRTKIYLRTLLIAFVTILGLTACMNEDEPKDITKEVTMYVSSETGIMYDLFDSEEEFPIECMLVKEQYLRVICDSPRNSYSLLLTAGKGVDMPLFKPR